MELGLTVINVEKLTLKISTFIYFVLDEKKKNKIKIVSDIE